MNIFSQVVFVLFLIECGIRTKQEMEFSFPCFDISSHFLCIDTVLSRPLDWQDWPGCQAWENLGIFLKVNGGLTQGGIFTGKVGRFFQ